MDTIKRYAMYLLVAVLTTLVVLAVLTPSTTEGALPTVVMCPTVGTSSTLTHVLVVGDSITFDASEEIMGMANMSGLVTTIDARPGTGLYAPSLPLEWHGVHYDYTQFSWVDRIPTLVASSSPDVVVVALGTNDAFFAGLPMYTSMVERVYAMAKGAEVYWVGLPERALSNDHLLRIQRVNRALAKVDALHSDFHVISPVVDGGLFRDKAHHNEYGQVAFADAILQAIK